MNSEKWRWRSSAAGSAATSPATLHPDTLLKLESVEPVETRRRRAFSRALRSLSNSSMDSSSSAPPRAVHGIRKLHNTSSGSGSVIERLHRRVSRESSASLSASESVGGPPDMPFESMEILRCGWLKADGFLLKSRSDYLVLTDHSLLKFSGPEAARAIFPQLVQMDTRLKLTPSSQSLRFKSPASEIRFEIPLRSIVALYGEDASSSRFSIDVWWFSQAPRLGYCRAHLNFALAKERNDWLVALQQAYKIRLRRSPVGSLVPDNIRIRISHAIQNAEHSTSPSSQQLIFPVAKRATGLAQKGSGSTQADDAQGLTEASSFFFVVGPCLCYLIEILSTDYFAPPGELKLKIMTFGTVTLTRFQATVASFDQRFAITFRSPFGREIRLDLASVFYRRIIETLTKVDRILKPMWPQNLQQAIFQIRGLPPPLHLTAGNDLGGLEVSLQAYCAAFNAPIPSWTIEWNTPSQPAFRLLPSGGSEYSPLQLLAVLRSLRYNSFFKAISFRDVSLSSLAGKKDFPQFGDCVVHTSLGGLSIPEEYHKILLESTVLEQEIHSLMFASESIRSVDFARQPVLGRGNIARAKMVSSELIGPILMLLRRRLCHCHRLSLSGNLLAGPDVEELGNLLDLHEMSITKLELAHCGLADVGLAKLWPALAGQADTLEWLDTSDNQGIVKSHLIADTLLRFRQLKILKIAGNTRLGGERSLFAQNVMNGWALRELDLSDIMLNDATVDVICGYLETDKSKGLQALRLNNSRLTGSQIARLLRSMGQARELTLHINANRLDEGIDDLCEAISQGLGPWSLFVSMTEFHQEINYVKFLRALTANKTIECLSLAGTATSEALSAAACRAVFDFFADNDTVRFLDISGYVSKLDEGRLGKEFSKALSGLRKNKRIGHLRVRDQMLNVNTGDLAQALSDNKTLHTVDCEGNEFNLSNFWHLIRHIESNETIRYFSAFSDQELAQKYQAASSPAENTPTSRRASMLMKLKPDKGLLVGGERPLEERLQDEWEAALGALSDILERNQRKHQKGKRSAEAGDDDDNDDDREDGRDGAGSLSPASGERLIEVARSRSRRTAGDGGGGSPLEDCLALLSTTNLHDLLDGPDGPDGPDERSLEAALRSSSAVSSDLSSNAKVYGDSDGLSPSSRPPEVLVIDPDLDTAPANIDDHEGAKGSGYDFLGHDEGAKGEGYDFLGYDDNAVLQMGSYGRMLCKIARRIDEEDERAETDAIFG